MPRARFVVSLRVFHPTLSAEDVVRMVGRDPRVTQSVGRRRRSPDGTELEGTYARTYVVFTLDASGHEALEDFLQHTVDSSFAVDVRVGDIVAAGGRAELFVGLFCDGSCGLELDAQLMAGLGATGLAVSLDFYPDPTHPSPE